MKTLLAILLTFVSGVALGADTAKVSWTPPVLNTAGEPLTGDNVLTGYSIYHHIEPITSANRSAAVKTDVNVELNEYTFELSGGATGLTYYFRVTAINAAGESALSAEVSKFIKSDVTVPEPPGNIVVSETVVYTVVKRVDGFRLYPVGTVPPNTPCISSETINGYNVVPRSSVTWSGDIRPDVVVAKCASSPDG
jgi:hypothetical protein